MKKEVFPGKINVIPIHILEESYKINGLYEEQYFKGLKGNEKKMFKNFYKKYIKNMVEKN